VKVDAETGTVVWATGADLDPIVIYQGLPPLNAKIARDVQRDPSGQRRPLPLLSEVRVLKFIGKDVVT